MCVKENMSAKVAEVQNHIVKKSNELARCAHRLTAREQKIMAYICSQIELPKSYYYEGQDSEVRVDECKLEHTFDIKFFGELCGIDSSNGMNQRELKATIQKLSDKSIWVADENGREVLVRWISKAYINRGTNTVVIRLDDDMIKHVFDLRKRFLSYRLYNVLTMKNEASIHLYEILRSYAPSCSEKLFSTEELKSMFAVGKEYFTYKKIDGNKSRSRGNEDESDLSVEEYEELSDEEKKLYKKCGRDYPNFNDFEKRILIPAITEINEFSDICVKYEKECRGATKAFTHVRFIFRMRHDGVKDHYENKALARLNGEDVSHVQDPDEPELRKREMARKSGREESSSAVNSYESFLDERYSDPGFMAALFDQANIESDDKNISPFD